MFFQNLFGKIVCDAVQEKSLDEKIGRQIKRELKQVAKHYRQEFNVMSEGGRFVGYL